MASANQPPEDLTDVLLDGRYRLVRLMGQGGMGQVYEGVHTTLGHKVAVKALLPQYAHDPKFRERFLREAKAASKVRHPNVVQIIDFGDTPGGSVYFVMEFLEGYDLKQLLEKEGPLGWPRARTLLVQTASALAAAHERNIIHRDIKPANLFIVQQRGQETIKVLDFGIAKLAASAATEESSLALNLTGTGEVFGTAKYMAPEQAQGASDDPRVDVYSLGIVAYEMLTGQVPFTGRSVFQIITRHINEAPRPPTELVPEIPPMVAAAILKALAKEPGERYASMEAMERVLSEISARPGTLPLIHGRGSPLPVPARPAWNGPMAWGKTSPKQDEATVRKASEASLISEEITAARGRTEVLATAPQLAADTDPSAPITKQPASAKRTEPRPATAMPPETVAGSPRSVGVTLVPTEARTPASAGVPSSLVATVIPTEAPAASIISPRVRVFIAAPSRSLEPPPPQRLGRVTSLVPTRLKVPAVVGELAVPPADDKGSGGPMGWASNDTSGGLPAVAMATKGSSPPPQAASESGVASNSMRGVRLGLLSTLFGGAVVLGGLYALSADRDDASPAPSNGTVVPEEPEGALLLGSESQGTQTSAAGGEPDAERVEPGLDAPPGGAIEPTNPALPGDVPAKPVPVASSTPPSRGAKARAAERPTDARVKAQLTRTLEKKCGALGTGAKATMKILVASDGRVMSKNVTGASGELQACLSAGVAGAEFPPGTTRTLTMTFP